MNTERDPWTVEKLHELLGQFEAELREPWARGDQHPHLLDRSTYFVRWLAGDYQPGQRR